MRSIKKIHEAMYAPIDDLITYRAMPTHTIQSIDPFLFLNHHGPQKYSPGNRGLPFGPHPHRGFETLTYILQGDIMHKDSVSGESVINTGGIQWMTAGSGLIHAEVSSEVFKKNGGMEELIQIWMNLPARYKMIAPSYQGRQKKDIPEIVLDSSRVTVNLVSGNWDDVKGPVNSLTDLHMSSIYFKEGGTLTMSIDRTHNILFYIVKGELIVNNAALGEHMLAEFANDGEAVTMRALQDSVLIFGHGKPFNEPVVAYGPFVMNSQAEIKQAMADYQSGKFGEWVE